MPVDDKWQIGETKSAIGDNFLPIGDKQSAIGLVITTIGEDQLMLVAPTNTKLSKTNTKLSKTTRHIFPPSMMRQRETRTKPAILVATNYGDHRIRQHAVLMQLGSTLPNTGSRSEFFPTELIDELPFRGHSARPQD